MKQSKLFSINSTSNMVLALITCLVHNPQFFVLTRMRAVTLPRDWPAIEPMIDVIVISQYKFAYSKTSSSYLCLPIPSPSVCAILSKYPPTPNLSSRLPIKANFLSSLLLLYHLSIIFSFFYSLWVWQSWWRFILLSLWQIWNQQVQMWAGWWNKVTNGGVDIKECFYLTTKISEKAGCFRDIWNLFFNSIFPTKKFEWGT